MSGCPSMAIFMRPAQVGESGSADSGAEKARLRRGSCILWPSFRHLECPRVHTFEHRESQTMAHLKSHVKRLLGWQAMSPPPAVPAPEPPRHDPPLDGPAAELLARARTYYWFHSIDLGNGVVTPGSKSLDLLRAEGDAIFGPLDLRGKSVLDIGAWNGNFSFEAKRRQAARGLATDHHCWTQDV